MIKRKSDSGQGETFYYTFPCLSWQYMKKKQHGLKLSENRLLAFKCSNFDCKLVKYWTKTVKWKNWLYSGQN